MVGVSTCVSATRLDTEVETARKGGLPVVPALTRPHTGATPLSDRQSNSPRLCEPVGTGGQRGALARRQRLAATLNS